jgi:hypothetical protein
MGLLLMFPVSVMVLAVWVLLEHVWQEFRARRIATRPVTTAEHLVHDRYEVLGDLYDTPSPTHRGG